MDGLFVLSNSENFNQVTVKQNYINIASFFISDTTPLLEKSVKSHQVYLPGIFN